MVGQEVDIAQMFKFRAIKKMTITVPFVFVSGSTEFRVPGFQDVSI
jgi:hypothetical protein